MTRFLLVCAGGALGSGARYLLASALPWGTFVVNVIGSFAIAFVWEWMRASDLRLFLITGILGGFTTYSAFNQEVLQSLRTGAWSTAAVNVAATLVGCLIAGFLGAWLADTLR